MHLMQYVHGSIAFSIDFLRIKHGRWETTKLFWLFNTVDGQSKEHSKRLVNWSETSLNNVIFGLIFQCKIVLLQQMINMLHVIAKILDCSSSSPLFPRLELSLQPNQLLIWMFGLDTCKFIRSDIATLECIYRNQTTQRFLGFVQLILAQSLDYQYVRENMYNC